MGRSHKARQKRNLKRYKVKLAMLVTESTELHGGPAKCGQCNGMLVRASLPMIEDLVLRHPFLVRGVLASWKLHLIVTGGRVL